MGKLFTLILGNFAGSAIKKMLLGAGLGLATSAIMMTVINYYIGRIAQQAGFLGDMAGILHLGGMDTAISIIIGAIVVRATVMATKLSIVKAGK